MSALVQGARRVVAIVRATALEILSEPLSLLLLLAALMIETLAPAFHFHQFGEAARMARDAGLSALFLCGTLFAVFGVLRSFRREVESGTLQMALAHPVTRTGFFLSKVLGAVAAQLVFAGIVVATVFVIVNGAEIGDLVSRGRGDIGRIWGPALALGVTTIVLPLAVGAVLNRFCRCRFVLTAFVLALACALAGAVIMEVAIGRYAEDGARMAQMMTGYRFHVDVAVRLLPVCVLLTMLALTFLSAAAAVGIRFRSNVAVAVLGVLAAVSVPAFGNYYLSDALTDANGGRVGWDYVARAALATLPAVVAFLLAGVQFARDGKIGDGE